MNPHVLRFSKLNFKKLNKAIYSLFLFPMLTFALIMSSCKKSSNNDIDISTKPPTHQDSIPKVTYLNPSENADAAYNAFMAAFLVRSGGDTYIVDGLKKRDRAYFWGQAFMITGLEDAYERTKSADRKQLINDLLNSFIANETADWSWNSWDDDIAWATIACIRGYLITGNTKFKDAAIKNWDFVWNRGWDNSVGGGIWENMDKYTKASLSNDPMIISGIFIYEATSDEQYLKKCKQIYDWVRSHLFDEQTGIVNEAVVNDGTVQNSDNAYNTGSFINAAASLYKHTKDSKYLADAQIAADHVINKFGVMNQEADACVRAIAKLAKDNNLGSKYYPWLVSQCIASWNNRSDKYYITNNDWRNPTPGGNEEQFSMQCISAVTVQSVTPAVEAVTLPDGTYKLTMRSNENALSTKNGATSNNTTLNTVEYTNKDNQQWVLTGLGNGLFKLTGKGSKKAINVSGNSGDDNAKLLLWDDNGAGNEKIYLVPADNGYYALFFVNSGKALSIANLGTSGENEAIQKRYIGTPEQQWKLTQIDKAE